MRSENTTVVVMVVEGIKYYLYTTHILGIHHHQITIWDNMFGTLSIRIQQAKVQDFEYFFNPQYIPFVSRLLTPFTNQFKQIPLSFQGPKGLE